MSEKKKIAYLPKFQRATAEASDCFELWGDNILIEEIKDEEVKTSSGIILAGEKRSVLGLEADRPTFARVLQVGKGYYDESTGEDVALNVEPGDIILVGKHSIKRFSVFGKLISYGETELGITRESEIQMRFRGQEGFDRYFATLNI